MTTSGYLWFVYCLAASLPSWGPPHGTMGFSKILDKLCRGPKSTLIITWIMGILIFVDDYLNIMTLSICMKKETDKHRIPREALSYVIDSTGAPVCALLPFSTWAVFFSGLFFAEAGVPELGYGSGISTFYRVIPFVFYAIAAVVIVPLFALSVIPPMGKMRAGLPAGGEDRSGLLPRERTDELGGRG